MRTLNYKNKTIYSLVLASLLNACAPSTQRGVTGPESAGCRKERSDQPCTEIVFSEKDGNVEVAKPIGNTDPDAESDDMTPHETHPEVFAPIERTPIDENEPGLDGNPRFPNTDEPEPGLDSIPTPEEGESTDDEDDGEGSGGGQNPGTGGNNVFDAISKGFGNLVASIVGGIGDLFGAGNQKKKEKEKEIRRKAAEAESMAKEMQVLEESITQNYNEDTVAMKDLKDGGSYFQPDDLQGQINQQGKDHNKLTEDVIHKEPAIDPKNAPPTNDVPKDESCFESGKCSYETPEQQKLGDAKDYIKGAREHVKENFTGEERKTREEILNQADNATRAAEQFYSEGDNELGDDAIKLAKQLADFAVSATPIVGEIYEISSAIAGENLITGEPIPPEEAIAQAAGAVISLCTGGALGIVKDMQNAGKILKQAAKEKIKREAKNRAGKESREQINERNKQFDEGERRARDAKETTSAQDHENKISKMAPGERVAAARTKAAEVAQKNGWTKNRDLSKKNNRDVYTDKEGNHWSVDTQHGTFEKQNSRGKHQGEYNIDLKQVDQPDSSGGHDIII